MPWIFYLMPDFPKITGSTVLGALGQAFFSLSLGGTFMMCYASYMSKKENIPQNALFTAIGDTTAGLLAGMVIIPAAVAVGLEATSGPSLTFITAPEIFLKIPGGLVFAAIFFLLLLWVDCAVKPPCRWIIPFNNSACQPFSSISSGLGTVIIGVLMNNNGFSYNILYRELIGKKAHSCQTMV